MPILNMAPIRSLLGDQWFLVGHQVLPGLLGGPGDLGVLGFRVS